MIRLKAKCLVFLLSNNNIGLCFKYTNSFWRSDCNQSTLVDVKVNAMYLASLELLTTLFCFPTL